MDKPVKHYSELLKLAADPLLFGLAAPLRRLEAVPLALPAQLPQERSEQDRGRLRRHAEPGDGTGLPADNPGADGVFYAGVGLVVGAMTVLVPLRLGIHAPRRMVF